MKPSETIAAGRNQKCCEEKQDVLTSIRFSVVACEYGDCQASSQKVSEQHSAL